MDETKVTSIPESQTAGVGPVMRALQILDAFSAEDCYLSLAELSARCGLHKTTALRLARTLGNAQYLIKREDGAWRLGPAAGWLGNRYQASFDQAFHIEPVLREIARQTGESAVFYAHEGDSRVCLYRIEGPHAARDHVRVGQRLPLAQGSAGKVILAFLGAEGDEYDAIRRHHYSVTQSDREADAVSLSVPIYGSGWRVTGSLSIMAHASRTSCEQIKIHAPEMIRLGNQLSIALGGKQVVRKMRA